MITRRLSRWPPPHLLCVLLCALVASSLGAQAPVTPSGRYRILVTNDDGVRAPGILAVAQALQSLGDVTIAAPADNQSGKGHSIVTSDPIFVDTVTLPGNLPAFSILATPATCVKVAVRGLMTARPDLVVSGINRGFNLGMVTYVSGTVGAAREAAQQQFGESLTLSLQNTAGAQETVLG